ncbi:type II toxin-antitoxin system Phd/YefM family antitoxin [Erythrobacter sp. WG]|uniref:type II toxin-antitoxin system Phd/YefM family antitoxin n=1 Tax=Erythrobacter sp. WG TaxID=2985510 RepID=UPI00226EA9ED|nr:type II toxin-antitoxin system prevent-host-death family antitoxin [Erythrobacter sp. WG]MCX9148630.1 type II toxin-antitoxin system prevent-host-death family antitoxin [Erythrobacter sp. WG]
MAIHVNIGDSRIRLSELLRAVQAGERVNIQRDGKPEAEIIPARETPPLTREQIAAKRRAAFGMYREAFKGADLSLEALKADRIDPDEYERKFDNPA